MAFLSIVQPLFLVRAKIFIFPIFFSWGRRQLTDHALGRLMRLRVLLEQGIRIHRYQVFSLKSFIIIVPLSTHRIVRITDLSLPPPRYADRATLMHPTSPPSNVHFLAVRGSLSLEIPFPQGHPQPWTLLRFLCPPNNPTTFELSLNAFLIIAHRLSYLRHGETCSPIKWRW